MSPKTAVIIPLHNGCDAVVRCARSLAWTPGDTRVEVLIVDSESTDGGAQAAVTVLPSAHLLSAEIDAWWTRATNLGCRYAIENLGADRLLLLNHDCEMTCEAFEALSSFADSHPDSIVCSRVMLPSGEMLFGGGEIGATGILRIAGYWSTEAAPPTREVAWCGGMGVIVPSTVYASAGGFDEATFPHYYADADFCLRCRRQGVPVLFCSEATVVNDKATSGLAVSRQEASLRLLLASLTSRRSVVNVRDTVLFYLRHQPWRFPIALSAVYLPHFGSAAKRILIKKVHWREA
jgi:GT2 family glycosyltransferase